MTNSIVPYQGNQIIRTMDDAERAAHAMSASGLFSDTQTAARAVVKILAGMELGFGPFASMKGVYIIQGGPSLSANLMAAAVKKSGRYNYRVKEMSEKVCAIAFLENGEEIGVSTFTAEDARKAGTKNMDKFPRNMLFARAMSNGVRWYCPDVFNGNTIYTPEELGENVNEEGEVIDVQPTTPPTNGNGKAHQEPPKVEAKASTNFIPEMVGFNGEEAQNQVDDHWRGESNGDREQPAEGEPEPLNYPKPNATIGKHTYPVQWARLFAAYTRADKWHVDGILQKLRLPADTKPEDAVTAVNKYIDAKAQPA